MPALTKSRFGSSRINDALGTQVRPLFTKWSVALANLMRLHGCATSICLGCLGGLGGANRFCGLRAAGKLKLQMAFYLPGATHAQYLACQATVDRTLVAVSGGPLLLHFGQVIRQEHAGATRPGIIVRVLVLAFPRAFAPL